MLPGDVDTPSRVTSEGPPGMPTPQLPRESTQADPQAGTGVPPVANGAAPNAGFSDPAENICLDPAPVFDDDAPTIVSKAPQPSAPAESPPSNSLQALRLAHFSSL